MPTGGVLTPERPRVRRSTARARPRDPREEAILRREVVVVARSGEVRSLSDRPRRSRRRPPPRSVPSRMRRALPDCVVRCSATAGAEIFGARNYMPGEHVAASCVQHWVRACSWDAKRCARAHWLPEDHERSRQRPAPDPLLGSLCDPGQATAGDVVHPCQSVSCGMSTFGLALQLRHVADSEHVHRDQRHHPLAPSVHRREPCSPDAAIRS